MGGQWPALQVIVIILDVFRGGVNSPRLLVRVDARERVREHIFYTRDVLNLKIVFRDLFQPASLSSRQVALVEKVYQPFVIRYPRE